MLDMIKCSTGGAYYARGEWVPADGNADAALAAKGFDAAAIANAKTGTMAYSILQAHNTLYTRPQDNFIDAGNGEGIGWALIDDITHAEIKEETIINHRHYHTIKEVKNGEGPHPIKTPKGWLHLAHGVRACAAGLRYVLYLYMTSLEDPTRIIAEPGGYLLAPEGEERIGDVSNVLFSNGWIADEDGTIYIYYASSDTRMHVATSTIERLIDYCRHTPEDKLRSTTSVNSIYRLIEANKLVMAEALV